MRRLVHVVILVLSVVVIRSCGGAVATEDRLAAGSRWFAEVTGLGAVRDSWRENVVPVVTRSTKSVSRQARQAVAGVLSRAELLSAEVANGAGNEMGHIADRIGLVFGVEESSDGNGQRNGAETDRNAVQRPAEAATSGR